MVSTYVEKYVYGLSVGQKNRLTVSTERLHVVGHGSYVVENMVIVAKVVIVAGTVAVVVCRSVMVAGTVVVVVSVSVTVAKSVSVA